MESWRDHHSHLALERAAQIRVLDSGVQESRVEYQLVSSIPVHSLFPASSVSLPVSEAGLKLVIPLPFAS